MMKLFQKKPESGKEQGDLPPSNAISFEAFRIDLVRASERKAWRLAAGAALVALLEAAAIAMLCPLKTTVPYVVELDRTTGMSTILPIANTREIPASEAQDKYWLGQYVLSRESYDYRTLELDYVKTRELSLPAVFEPYASQFGDGKETLEKRWGDTRRAVVTLTSVVPSGDGIATVRFTKRVVETSGGQEISSGRYTATIGYEYHPEFRATEGSRLVNPFGFKVTTYRVDEEVGTGEARHG
ncbi:MAG: type IV secretion system protein [Mesosutterella sp.]|nr:type IV secretion system protein [Mesosutterella sp.]